jgi:purine-binding chemotaxis protein CheW
MTSSTSRAERLLEELRRHFATDPEGNLERLGELAAGFARQPTEAIAEILAICHNVKGSAQAVGFMPLAEVVHAFEDALGRFAGRAVAADELARLDPLLGRAVDALAAYCRQLAADLEDRAELGASARAVVAEIAAQPASGTKAATSGDGWALFDDEPVAALPPPQPQQSQPAAAPPVAPEQPADPQAPLTAAAAPAPPKRAKYLLLEQAGALFAVHLADVREIISHQYVNPLPAPSPGISGLIVVRDRALPVVDLGGLFRREAAADNHACVVICESDGHHFAFSVERPRQVVDLAGDQLEPLPAKLGGEAAGLARNVASVDGRSVLVVDLRAVVA